MPVDLPAGGITLHHCQTLHKTASIRPSNAAPSRFTICRPAHVPAQRRLSVRLVQPSHAYAVINLISRSRIILNLSISQFQTPMPIKISLIGGQRCLSLNLMRDLCLTPNLYGSTINFMDIDKARSMPSTIVSAPCQRGGCQFKLKTLDGANHQGRRFCDQHRLYQPQPTAG